MIERAIFGAGILMLAVYTFTPREGGGSDSRASKVDAESAPGIASNRLAASRTQSSFSSGGQTILPRMGDGHFYAEVRVNGSTSRFLVDTGASVIALTGEDARAAGIDWDESDIRPIGSGASGPVYGVPAVLDEVSLDGHETRSVAAVVVPEGLEISLLGQSFLGQIDEISVRDDEMVLGD
jgi:aspartyl protease family protein